MTFSKLARPLILAALALTGTAWAGPFDKINQNLQHQKDRLNQQAQDAEIHFMQTRDHIVELAAQDGFQLWGDSIHDLMAGKTVLVDELVCGAKSIKDGSQVNGSVQINGITPDSKLVLSIGKLLGVDADRIEANRDLAVQYNFTGIKDATGFHYNIVDLKKPDQPIQNDVTAESLGINVDCSQRERLVRVQDGQLKIDSDAVQRVIDTNSALGPDLRSIAQTPNQSIFNSASPAWGNATSQPQTNDQGAPSGDGTTPAQ